MLHYPFNKLSINMIQSYIGSINKPSTNSPSVLFLVTNIKSNVQFYGFLFIQLEIILVLFGLLIFFKVFLNIFNFFFNLLFLFNFIFCLFYFHSIASIYHNLRLQLLCITSSFLTLFNQSIL